MILLGVDPGEDRVGLAIIKQTAGKQELLYSVCLITDKKDTFSHRLLMIGEKVEKVLTTWQPTVMAIEKLFFTVSKKTAMAVAEARGVIIYLGAKHNLTIAEYTPLEIKTCVTGYGSADKRQITEMIPRLIKINKIIKYDDEYDAIGVALTYLAHAPFVALSTPK